MAAGGDAVPIALAVNILRITATGLLHVWSGPRLAGLVFHDLAGWLMMPAALGLLWLEVKFLSYVFVDEAVPETEQRGNHVRVVDGLRLPGGAAT